MAGKKKTPSSNSGGRYLIVRVVPNGPVYIVSPSELGAPISNAKIKKHAKHLIMLAKSGAAGVTLVEGALLSGIETSARISDANHYVAKRRITKRDVTKRDANRTLGKR